MEKLKKRGYEDVEDEDIGEMNFEENLYFALKILNMTEEEFWNMSPFLFDELLSIHLRIERSKVKNGR